LRIILKLKNKMGIGDWGLGIGDWAQSPIPNPQSPIPNPQSPYFLTLVLFSKIINKKIINSLNNLKIHE
jgi:hypothetical protein